MKIPLFTLATLLIACTAANAQTNGQQPITYFLTSTLLAAVVSAAVSAFIAVKLKDKEYRNDYYKQIIAKRLKTYEYLENQLILLRPHMYDEKDKKMYLKIFGFGKERFNEETNAHLDALNASFWLTYPTHTLLGKLNHMLTEIKLRYKIDDPEELIKAGKEYNYVLSNLRIELEAALRQDMHELYNVDRFFKSRPKLNFYYRSEEIFDNEEFALPEQDPTKGMSNSTFFLQSKK